VSMFPAHSQVAVLLTEYETNLGPDARQPSIHTSNVCARGSLKRVFSGRDRPRLFPTEIYLTKL